MGEGLKVCRKNRGSAMLMVLVASICVSLLIAIGYSILQNSIRTTRSELTLKGQAYNVAASGIASALSWYRSRRTQPVRKFDPEPSAYSTAREAGLIRHFEVSRTARLWGRFVVASDRVEDISDLRGRGRKGDGLVWRVRSEGILYVNRDERVPYDTAPNEIVNRLMLMTEFQRLNLNPPTASAILAENGKQIEILEGGRVRGLNGAGLTFRHGTGRPQIAVPFEVTSGTSNRINPAPEKNYRLDVRSIFGVTWRELRELYDILVESTQILPKEMPRMSIVFIDGDAVFDQKRPLMGGGLLIVNGTLQIAANSNSTYAGVIYCRGSFSMDAPALISGTVIALGGVRLQGFGDFAEIQYNGELIGTIKQRLGQYRQTQAMIQVKN